MPALGPLPITNTHPDPHNASFVDWNNEPAEPLLAAKCQAAISGRLYRTGGMAAPPKLYIDPLTPLPLVDAADGVVKIIYFILASRPFGEETINRNVVALQKPGALEAVGANDSNLFLVHVDAKLGDERKHELRDVKLTKRPDVYVLQKTRPVLWAGWSMILALWDAMTSVVRRGLKFEYFINLSDADLTLRTDLEIRAFLSRWPGRSIMSIVQRNKDPRRYKMHEGFRAYCWTECEGGAGFVVSGGAAHAAGFTPDAFQVIGKRKCCWSRTRTILYSNAPLQCPNAQLPETYHGSQWATLHHSLVRHMVDHPFVRRIIVAMEHTLLPDEAMLQTIAVNSPFRRTIIPAHLRYIEWPQSHGDANKYWASLGPQFHGGPMVLNASLALKKAFKSSAMFARKVDPGLYRDVLWEWDKWMDYKMLTHQLPDGQAAIAQSYTQSDPMLDRGVPPPTVYDNGFKDEPLLEPVLSSDGWKPLGDGHRPTLAPDPQTAPAYSRLGLRPAASSLLARLLQPGAPRPDAAPNASAAHGGDAAHAHDHHDEDGHGHHTHGDEHERHHGDGGEGDEHEGHTHATLPSMLSAFLLLWVFAILAVGSCLLCYSAVQEFAPNFLPRRFFRSRKTTLHAAKVV